MREGRPRAVRSRRRLVISFGAPLLCLLASANGCATEVSTLEEPPTPSDAGTGGAAPPIAAAGGKAPVAGSAANGGAAGAVVSAFGGTANAGGKTAGGAAGASAGQAGAGQGGAGGKGAGGQGGATGNAGRGSVGGGGQSGGSQSSGGQSSGGQSSGGSAGGGGLVCLAGWKGSACDTCSTQTQSDKLACIKILDCYAARSCGPATCAGNDDPCGANKIGQGTAGYPIAKEVYDCACQ